MPDPWKRLKTVVSVGTSPGATLTFDEGTPLDSTHLLVAIVQKVTSATLANEASLTAAGWTKADVYNSGSTNYVEVWTKQGDGATNSFTYSLSPNASHSGALFAFEGFVSTAYHARKLQSTGSSTSKTAGPLDTATTVANTLALAVIGLTGGGGGTWGTFNNGFVTIPESLSRLHVGVKPFTATTTVGTTTITHSSARAGLAALWVFEGVEPAANTPPTVSISGSSQKLVGDLLTLGATASDPDGTIAVYSWSVVSCDTTAPTLSGASSSTVTFVPDRPMTVVLRCAVEDNLGGSAFADYTVRVSIDRGLTTDRGAPYRVTARGASSRPSKYRGAQRSRLGLIAQWSFTEAYGPFYSDDVALPLADSGTIYGIASPWGGGVHLDSGAYATIPAASLGALNLGDWTGKVTVAAWVRRTNTSTGFIAGTWQEDAADPRRQYGLFAHLPMYGGSNMACFHVSKTGGATPGYPYSRDYSSHPTPLTNGVWQLHVGTYDGGEARSYLNGNFTAYPTYTDGLGNTYAKNPYVFTDGLNSILADFTVGAVKLSGGMGNYFAGDLALVRVWNRALPANEIAALYAAEAALL